MFEEAIEQLQDDRFVLGAFDKDQIIGICGFVSIKTQTNAGLRNIGSLIQLYGKPDYRGMGIGLHLVDYLIEEGFQIPGVGHIVLEVTEDNQPAIRIYEQAGFVSYDPVFLPGKQSTPGSLRMVHNGISNSSKKF